MSPRKDKAGKFLPGNGGGPGRPRKKTPEKTETKPADLAQETAPIEISFPEIADPRKRAFLAAYSISGQIPKAAKIAGVCGRTHYNWMRDDEGYNKVFEEARTMFNDVLEAEAARRAVEGTLKPVYQGKELVGYVREYSDTMLAMKLKGHMPDKYRENTRQELVHSGSLTVESVVHSLEQLRNAKREKPE